MVYLSQDKQKHYLKHHYLHVNKKWLTVRGFIKWDNLYKILRIVPDI